jgi:signal recognition particle receptor subunit beta
MRIVDNKVYFKLIFAGTALAGKTTALQWVFKNVIPEGMKLTKEVRSLKTSFQQTLMFDFAPIKVSDNIFFRIYATTGQDYYSRVRELLTEGVDGLFFVVDSQKNQLEFNREFVGELFSFLRLLKVSKEMAEVVVLYNKRDLPEIYPVDFLKDNLKLEQFESYGTNSINGENLQLAFQSIVGKCLAKLKAVENA